MNQNYKSRKIIAFQMDPLNSINIQTDTSFLLALELQKKGYNIFFYEVGDLYLKNNQLLAIGIFTELTQGDGSFYKIITRETLNLEEVLLVMVRQDPPFNMHYITSTYLLEIIQNKTLILNNPTSLRNLPEKFSPLFFENSIPDSIPDYVLSANFEIIKKFSLLYQEIVLKPLYQHGGQGVILIRSGDKNFDEVVKKYIKKFGHIMAQEFIDTVKDDGDKRVIFLNERVIGYYKRLPKKGDFRSNTVLGGSFEQCDLTENESILCKEIGAFLNENNIFFAGVDILNERLIEINITSPTGLAVLNKLYGNAYEKIVAEAIEIKINSWYKLRNSIKKFQ